MDLVQRFEAYAADFEHTFVDDDFTEDTTYSTTANSLRITGREKVLAVLRAAVSGFDRRCDSRTLITTEGPRAAGDEVLREWAATFTLQGAPDIRVEGSERAVFRGDRILLLEISMTPETLSRLLHYREAYIADPGH
jgi:hypothetical protein